MTNEPQLTREQIEILERGFRSMTAQMRQFIDDVKARGPLFYMYQRNQVVHLNFPDHKVDAFYRIKRFNEDGSMELEEVD